MTIDDAKKLHRGDIVHYTGPSHKYPYGHPCTRTVGPRGGVKTSIIEVRISGRVQTWKRDPNRVRVPAKYGLYEYTAIDEHNTGDYHRAADCPLNKESNQ